MDILSDYRISSHWANDDAHLQEVAEQVRQAYEQLDARQQSAGQNRRHARLGFLHRARHA
jgi:hypothetical protein